MTRCGAYHKCPKFGFFLEFDVSRKATLADAGAYPLPNESNAAKPHRDREFRGVALSLQAYRKLRINHTECDNFSATQKG